MTIGEAEAIVSYIHSSGYRDMVNWHPEDEGESLIDAGLQTLRLEAQAAGCDMSEVLVLTYEGEAEDLVRQRVGLEPRELGPPTR
jgi:hypothetical protein